MSLPLPVLQAAVSNAAAKPKLPEDFEDRTWAKLQDAVIAVQEKRPVACSLEELYRVRV